MDRKIKKYQKILTDFLVAESIARDLGTIELQVVTDFKNNHFQFSPLLVFSTNNRTNNLVSDYQVVIRKNIHPIAFARVVGGKHQTTADEFGTPTKAKWEFNSWDIPFIVIDDIEMNVWELMLKSGFEVD